MLITLKHKFVINLYYGDKPHLLNGQCCRCTLELKLRKPFLNLFTKQVLCPLAFLFWTFQTANQYLNTCHYMAEYLYLHDSYITKFDFMNYAFANLVVAW